MSYVIYHNETTKLLDRNKSYSTERSAKSARTRAFREGKIASPEEWSISDRNEFYNSIEKKRIVKNLMSGQDVEIGVNTPLHLDPSSETYWSM